MTSRLKQFSLLIKKNKLNCYLIFNDADIRYITGFPASESVFIVFPTKSIYLTDSRYVEEAKSGIRNAKVEHYAHNINKSIFDILAKNRVKTVGFDARHVTLAQFRSLGKVCPKSIKLIAVNHLVEGLREIKDKEEVSQIQACLKLNLAAYEFARRVIRPGMTEKQVLLKLENFVRSRGAGFSFPPIIASGPNSAFPHARVSDRRIKNNEPVLVDMGIEINGYKSDLTRMFFLGKMPALYINIYKNVDQARKIAITKIRAGVRACDVDQKARNYLEGLGLAKYFGHSLGHGVGLDIHESPRLSSQNKRVLEPGMVVTVEPGVYLPGKFGVRIEDMVLVTKTGCKVLSRTAMEH